MASHYRAKARGIRKHSAIITVAAPATPENLYLQTTGGQNPRTVIVRKIMTYGAGAPAIVQIGTGLAPFVPILPSLTVLAALDNGWIEDEIIEVEVNANLTVQSSVLGVQVQVEVEEVGS